MKTDANFPCKKGKKIVSAFFSMCSVIVYVNTSPNFFFFFLQWLAIEVCNHIVNPMLPGKCSVHCSIVFVKCLYIDDSTSA